MHDFVFGATTSIRAHETFGEEKNFFFSNEKIEKMFCMKCFVEDKILIFITVVRVASEPSSL